MLPASVKAVSLLSQSGMIISFAESCTGGMLAASITDVPGASKCFDRSYVCYSKRAKREMLGIPASVLEEFGTVSGEVAAAMAESAMLKSGADISCSVTGSAGPGLDEYGNPAGMVFIACASSSKKTMIRKLNLEGDRNQVRAGAVSEALRLVCEMLSVEGEE